MTEYLTEQEQVEILKRWIKQYSLVILAGLVIAVIAIWGWRSWQYRQNKTLTHASSVYDEMLTLRVQNSSTAAPIDKLLAHYPHTVYAELAAFMLARSAAIKGDYPEAEKQLNWVLDHSKIKSIRQIAAIRLARILIAEHKPEAGLKILQDVQDKNFSGLIDEVKGDAYVAMHNIQQAQQAYGLALNEIPNAETTRPLLQMKYDNLATTTPNPSAP